MKNIQRGLWVCSVTVVLAVVMMLSWGGKARAGDILSDQVVDSLLFQTGQARRSAGVGPPKTIGVLPQEIKRLQPPLMMGFSQLGRFKGLSIMALIVVGVSLLVLLARRFGWLVRSRVSSGATIRMVSTRSLGDKRAIAVVEVEGRRLVVGMTPHQMTLLASLPEPAEEPKMRAIEEEVEFSLPTVAERGPLPPSISLGKGRYVDIQGLMTARR